MDFNKLVTKKEVVYFNIMLIISVILYLVIILSVVGIFYIILFAFSLYLAQAFSLGHLKSNSVKITQNQFPDIYEKIQKYSSQLGLKKLPDVYITQSGGLLNAFVTRVCFRDFLVIYSDVLELAYEQGENAVNFIIAHELAHVKREHLSKAKWIACAQLIPFLNTAYSRACEYTCDNIAAALVPNSPYEGMLALIAGKKLYKMVNVDNLIQNSLSEDNYWSWASEIYSTHPHLINRIKNLKKLNYIREAINEDNTTIPCERFF